MTLKVFYDIMSQPCRALLIFLKVNKIPFEPYVIALRKGEHKMPEFSKLNPFQKVPVVEHDGFILTESIAIIRYLSREFIISDNWYPKDSKNQARVDEYLEWQHLNVRLFGSMAFRERVVTPILTQSTYNEKRVEFYQKNFLHALHDIEKGFLKNKAYLCGDTISAADIFCACEVEQALVTGIQEPFAKALKVKDWLERVRKELDPYYSEVHSILPKFADAILKGKL